MSFPTSLSMILSLQLRLAAMTLRRLVSWKVLWTIRNTTPHQWAPESAKPASQKPLTRSRMWWGCKVGRRGEGSQEFAKTRKRLRHRESLTLQWRETAESRWMSILLSLNHSCLSPTSRGFVLAFLFFPFSVSI